MGEIPRELSLLSEFSVSNPGFYVYYVIPFPMFDKNERFLLDIPGKGMAFF